MLVMWHEDAVERIMMDYSWYLRGGRGVFPLAREGDVMISSSVSAAFEWTGRGEEVLRRSSPLRVVVYT